MNVTAEQPATGNQEIQKFKSLEIQSKDLNLEFGLIYQFFFIEILNKYVGESEANIRCGMNRPACETEIWNKFIACDTI